KDMEDLVQNLKTDIPRAFDEESYQKERASIIRDFNERSSEIFKKINMMAADYGFMIRQSGSGFITVPIMVGQPIGEEQYRRLNEQQSQDIEKRSARLQEKIIEFMNQIRDLEKECKQTQEHIDHRVSITASGHR